jgi:hypothetical protein
MLVTVSWPDNHTDDIDTYVEDPRRGDAADLRRLPSLNATASGKPAAGPDFRFFRAAKFPLKFGC